MQIALRVLQLLAAETNSSIASRLILHAPKITIIILRSIHSIEDDFNHFAIAFVPSDFNSSIILTMKIPIDRYFQMYSLKLTIISKILPITFEFIFTIYNIK